MLREYHANGLLFFPSPIHYTSPMYNSHAIKVYGHAMSLQNSSFHYSTHINSDEDKVCGICQRLTTIDFFNPRRHNGNGGSHALPETGPSFDSQNYWTNMAVCFIEVILWFPLLKTPRKKTNWSGLIKAHSISTVLLSGAIQISAVEKQQAGVPISSSFLWCIIDEAQLLFVCLTDNPNYLLTRLQNPLWH